MLKNWDSTRGCESSTGLSLNHRAGIAEGVIMKIGGWRTRSVFERYAIVSQTDIADALKKLEAS